MHLHPLLVKHFCLVCDDKPATSWIKGIHVCNQCAFEILKTNSEHLIKTIDKCLNPERLGEQLRRQLEDE